MENKQDIYTSFSGLLIALGGVIGGAVMWLLTLRMWLTLPFFLILGGLLGTPAAWLTARSVRKRGLRCDWRGCLKTAAFGAWWSAATTGIITNILMFQNFTSSDDGTPMDWTNPDWYLAARAVAVLFAMPAICGAVSALLLSACLPRTDFRQPENPKTM